MNISVRGPSVLMLALVASLASKGAADAASVYWAATSSSDWSATASWSGSAVPTSADSAFVVNGGTATITQPGETCSRLTLGGAGSGTIKLNSGSLIVSNAVYEELIGNASAGSFMQSGGTHSIAHVLYLGNAGGAIGTYVLSGGSLAVPTVDVGNSGPGSFSQSGGTCSISSELDEGVSTGSSGTYTLSGSGLLAAWQEVIGDEANCSFTQSGGTNSVASGLVLGQNQGATGTYNLNGGLLIVSGTDGLIAGEGIASLNMNGGTLHSGASLATGVPVVIGPGSNAVFDTGSGTLTLSAGLSGSGKLTKSGSGVLVLSGTNSYSGGTTVASGTLRVLSSNSLLGGSSLTVGSSASSYFASPIVPFDAPGSLQAVPEPSTMALFGLCAIGIAGWLRLSRRSSVIV
jgi:fibronectin-binding autotransporter adhesin